VRDIYSPLEIDEEWDNFSPADTSAAVATPETVVPVMAQPEAKDMSTGSAEPMTDAARDAANQNIQRWFEHDGSAKGNEMPATQTDTLEISDTGAKPAEATTPPTEPASVTKVGVVGADDVATAERNDTSDAPDPIVLDAAPAIKTEEEPVTSTAAPEAGDTAEAKPDHAVAWEDEQVDSTEEEEKMSHNKETDTSNNDSDLEQYEKETSEIVERAKKKREEVLASIETMNNDLDAKTKDFQMQKAAIEDEISTAKAEVSEYDEFISRLEVSK
jgi:hypothetical protein